MSEIMAGNIIPLSGYVVVNPEEVESQTSSGIFLPSNDGEKPQIGVVLSTSSSHINEHGVCVQCPVMPGDKVVYRRWVGNEIKAGGKELQIMKYEDLIAVIN